MKGSCRTVVGVPRSAAAIALSPEQEAELRRQVRTPSIAQKDAARARIVLRAAEGATNTAIAGELGAVAAHCEPLASAVCARGSARREDAGAGWAPGRHRFDVSAVDRAGNVRHTRGTFTVAGARLTSEGATAALAVALTSHFGTAFTAAPQMWLACPASEFLPPGGKLGGSAACEFEFGQPGGLFHGGYTIVTLLEGRRRSLARFRGLGPLPG
jgi:hypothetical protein